jgi:hypothetical protein
MTRVTHGAGGIRPARLTAVIAVLGVAIVVTATGSSGLSGGGAPQTIVGSSDGGALAHVHHGPALAVSGTSPHGLAPGVTRPITVTVRNSTDQHVRIKKVNVIVGNASSACRATGNITTTAYHAHAKGATAYVVWHNHAAHVPLTISMIDTETNQDACKGRAFPLTFSATGKKG